jgi:hypothetical protein
MEQETEKQQVLKLWSSNAPASQKGRVMADYLKKYHGPTAPKTVPEPSMRSVFDGRLPLPE